MRSSGRTPASAGHVTLPIWAQTVVIFTNVRCTYSILTPQWTKFKPMLGGYPVRVFSSWPVVAVLVDDVRRALYDYVRRQDHPVTREEAAEASRISRGLAAFHLDKLVDAGLLRAWEQAPQHVPRGRGRSPKVYQPSGAVVALSVPERRYELVAQILADAIAHAPDDAPTEVTRGADRRGRQIGVILAEAQRQRHAGASVMPRACHALAKLGFEPGRVDTGQVRLHNCPFHSLAMAQPGLICGLNRAFVQGVLSGMGLDEVTAVLSPQRPACCVVLTLDRPTAP